jgi:hypothetical protein
MLPPLPDHWEPTRETLHEYALRLRALARSLAQPHPRFWHVGLTLGETGLRTVPMPLPGGDRWTTRLDFARHVLAFEVEERQVASIALGPATAGTALDTWLVRVLDDLGMDGAGILDDDTFGEPGKYDAAAAAAFWRILRDVADVFESRRRAIRGDVGPIHVWPNGFDASFEWFAPEAARHDGAQLNVGFYPAEPAYFYSNPYPFDETLLAMSLPHGATWHHEGWKGSMLPYDTLVGDADGDRKLIEYLEAVAAAARPTLDL